jgi:hypothetical protein
VVVELVDHVLRIDVELLDFLSLDVLVAGGADDVGEPGAGGPAGDELAREGDVVEELGEGAAR